MTVMEGVWDCSHCGEKHIPGHLTKCPDCGDPCDAAFNPEEGYYLPGDARVVTDTNELARANEGPNWTCGHCGEMNRAGAANCTNCGQPKDNDDQEMPVVEYVDGKAAEGVEISNPDVLKSDWADAMLQGESPEQVLTDKPVSRPVRTLASSDLPRSAPGSPYPDVDREQAAPKTTPVSRVHSFISSLNKTALMVTAAIAILVLALVGGGIWIYNSFFATHTVELTVQSVSWSRQVEVEEYRTLHDSGWTVPGDGRVTSSYVKVRSYRPVFDHNETKYRQVGVRVAAGSHSERYACGNKSVNKGNGYFSSETIYCNRMVTDYRTDYHQEAYQVPVYRNEPVYGTWYSYDVDRWVTDHWNEAKGGNEKPYWPEPVLNTTKQRIGDGREELYQVVLVDNEKRSFQKATSLGIWSALSAGMKLQGEENSQGSLREVHWPSPAS